MNKEKTCSVCGITLTIDCFYKDRQKKDGLYSSCKQCQSGKCRKYYLKNNARIKKLSKQYSKSEKGRIVSRETASRMWIKHKDRCRARAKIAYALKQGRIKRECCQICKDDNTQAHHPSYKTEE